MGGNRRFAGAVLASLLLHGWLLWRYSPIPLPAELPVLFDVRIEPAPAAIPETPAVPEAPPAPETAVIEDPPATVPDVQPMISILPPSVAEDEERIERPAADTILNLERPADWDDIVNSLPAPGSLPFNPGLSEGVALRTAEKKRLGLLNARSAAVYGVADDAFDRKGGLGREKKMDGQCYVLVDDPSVEKGSRWWASQCKDTKTNPLSLDPVEYDAVGRIISP